MRLPLSFPDDIVVSVTASVSGEDTTFMYEVPQGCTLAAFKDMIMGNVNLFILYVYISSNICNDLYTQICKQMSITL